MDTAAKISATAREHGAQPVAVFVDEDFADIVRTCKQAGIGMAQLHGKGARGSLHDLPNWLQASTPRPPFSLPTPISHCHLQATTRMCCRKRSLALREGAY